MTLVCLKCEAEYVAMARAEPCPRCEQLRLNPCRWLCFTCRTWNAETRTSCLSCCRPRSAVNAVADAREVYLHLAGVLGVLGYVRRKDDVWEHPCGPALDGALLGEPGLVSESDLVCWLVGQGHQAGARAAREEMRTAVQALLRLGRAEDDPFLRP